MGLRATLPNHIPACRSEFLEIDLLRVGFKKKKRKLKNFFFSNIVRRLSSPCGAVRLVLISPLNCWQSSIPFLCKTSFCMLKINNFRARAIDHSVLFFIHTVLPKFFTHLPQFLMRIIQLNNSKSTYSKHRPSYDYYHYNIIKSF